MFYILESGDGAGYKDIKDPEWRSGDGFTFEYLEKNGRLHCRKISYNEKNA